MFQRVLAAKRKPTSVPVQEKCARLGKDCMTVGAMIHQGILNIFEDAGNFSKHLYIQQQNAETKHTPNKTKTK